MNPTLFGSHSKPPFSQYKKPYMVPFQHTQKSHTCCCSSLFWHVYVSVSLFVCLIILNMLYLGFPSMFSLFFYELAHNMIMHWCIGAMMQWGKEVSHAFTWTCIWFDTWSCFALLEMNMQVYVPCFKYDNMFCLIAAMTMF